MIVENKPGAAGTLGAGGDDEREARRLHLTQIPISVFRLPHIEKTPFDPLTDLTYILGVSGYTFGVVVRSDAPWKTWNEFMAFAKSNPDKFSYGTPGANTSLHITMEEIAFKQGLKWVHVPHKGNAPNMAALLGGHVDSAADATGWGPHVNAGKMRLLVTWGDKRTKRWPDVPTLKEVGYRHRFELTLRHRRTEGHGSEGREGDLHDAFKKGMEDPIHLARPGEVRPGPLVPVERGLHALRPGNLRRRESDDGADEGAVEVADLRRPASFRHLAPRKLPVSGRPTTTRISSQVVGSTAIPSAVRCFFFSRSGSPASFTRVDVGGRGRVPGTIR